MEKYLWQGMTRLLAVYDGTDNLLMRFEYADDRVPMAMTRGGAAYYLTHDQVGSLRVVVDGAGNIVKRIDYDSFGNVLYDNNPGFAVPLGFAGGLYDRDIKLVRFGFRDYDPDIGRWTAKDPVRFAAGNSDLFGYCWNNPVNNFDPLGLMDIGEAYGHIEGALKPYLVAGGLVVTGAATAVAGGALAVAGYGSIPATGPAGFLIGTTGVLVAGAGAAQFVLGLDVYSDEIRYRLGLPDWFDVIRGFELLPQAPTQTNEKEGACK